MPAGRRREDRQFIPDTPEDFVFIAIGMLVFFSIVYFNYKPVIMLFNEYRYDRFAEYSGGEIIFPEKYIARIDEDYDNKIYESAYCVVLDGNRVVKLFSADIRTASERDVIFMCPSYADGAVHTHSPKAPELSEVDKQSFLNNNNYDLMCVYSKSLQCWVKKDGDVAAVRVRVVPDAS